MGRFILVLILALGLFGLGAWRLDLIPTSFFQEVDPKQPGKTQPAGEKSPDLGENLYTAQDFYDDPPTIISPKNYIVVPGHFAEFEKQDVPSPVDGQLLFVGEQVREGVPQAAGLAPFMTDPYEFATVQEVDVSTEDSKTKIKKSVVLYRRLVKDQMVRENQMVALLDPEKAHGDWLIKSAKILAAEAELQVAHLTREEAKVRYEKAEILYKKGAIAREEYTAAKLTYERYVQEVSVKLEAVKLAKIETALAELALKKHAIIPVKRSIVKSILRHRGEAVKSQEPILQLFSIDRLWAEATVETFYSPRERMKVILEPLEEEAPIPLKGHRGEVTSVAVSKDHQILSGSLDKTVHVWNRNQASPVRVLVHPEEVRVVASSPPQATHNICLVGCGDGKVYLWDLEEPQLLRDARNHAGGDSKQVQKILEDLLAAAKDKKDAQEQSEILRAQRYLENKYFQVIEAFGDSVTALAFNSDGTYFAAGGANGAIALWNTLEAKAVYSIDSEQGTPQGHTGTVTSLHFTPQCLLISASRDNTLRTWSLKKKGAVLYHSPFTDRSSDVAHLGVSRDGHWMLFDPAKVKELHFLSVKDGRTLATLQNPAGAIPFQTLALFSPDGSLLLTAGAPEGRLQLWRAPTPTSRGFEVRQFVTDERSPVTCAAFSPQIPLNGQGSFAVSGSQHGYVYIWPVPSKDEVDRHQIQGLKLDRVSQAVENSSRQLAIGVEVQNTFDARNPNGRLKPGRPVTIVIER